VRAALHAEWTKWRTTPGPAWLLLAGAAAIAGLGVPVNRLAGIYLGQAAPSILAVLTISTEYSTGLIRVTLAATPRRAAVLAAKATVLAVTVAAAGGVALLVVRTTPRVWAGSVLYLVLVGLLSLGIGVLVRDSAAAIGTVLGLLYLPPLLAFSVGDPHWQRLVDRAAPMSAASGSGGGLAVLAAWAGGALLAGALVFRGRDA
jgi:ABC-2 type transport system permease protein